MGRKLSAMPAATIPLGTTDLVMVVQGGVNKKAENQDVGAGGGGASSFAALTGVPSDNAALDAALNAKADDAATTAALAGKVDTASVGVASGVCDLDAGGLVPSARLPAYVDDVIEAADFASLPGTGATGKIYITLDDSKQYRWSGTVYVELVASPGTTDDVVEGGTNLYFTAARVRAVVLTGLSLASSAAITATSTVLEALGQLQAQISLKANALNAALTGVPTAPTASPGTNSTQVATTAYADAAATLARTPNVQAVVSSATVTPTFANDLVKITAQAAALALANPTGTAIDGHAMVIRIKDNGTARAITYDTEYRAIGVTLPTTTVLGKTLYLAMAWNSEDDKWDVFAVGQEA